MVLQVVATEYYTLSVAQMLQFLQAGVSIRPITGRFAVSPGYYKRRAGQGYRRTSQQLNRYLLLCLSTIVQSGGSLSDRHRDLQRATQVHSSNLTVANRLWGMHEHSSSLGSASGTRFSLPMRPGSCWEHVTDIKDSAGTAVHMLPATLGVHLSPKNCLASYSWAEIEPVTILDMKVGSTCQVVRTGHTGSDLEIAAVLDLVQRCTRRRPYRG